MARLSDVNRRLEDQIRDLCALAVVVRHDDERELVLAELRSALSKHTERMKQTAVLNLVEHEEGFPERRSA